MAGHILQGLVGAAGPEAEKYYDKSTGFISKKGWDLMYGTYLAHHALSTPSGKKKHGTIGNDLKVGALCHDVSSYAISSITDRLKTKAARISGRIVKDVAPYVARAAETESAAGVGFAIGTRKAKAKSKSPVKEAAAATAKAPSPKKSGFLARVGSTLKGAVTARKPRMTQEEQVQLQKVAERAYKEYVELTRRIDASEYNAKSGEMNASNKHILGEVLAMQKEELKALRKKAIDAAEEAHTRAGLTVGWKAFKHGGGGSRR